MSCKHQASRYNAREFARHERISENVQRVLAPLVGDTGRAVGGTLVTLTKVRVSADLCNARIHVSVLDAEHEQGVIEALAATRGRLRRAVARELRLRKTPSLSFVLDKSASRAATIDVLLNPAGTRKPAQ